MEIHELNTFSGTPGAGDFLATDNGTDTSKIAIKTITDPLNARIDNIITGPSSSAEEVIDARLGASVLGSTQYNSLGDAVRGQVAELYNDIGFNFDGAYTVTDNLIDLTFDKSKWKQGYPTGTQAYAITLNVKIPASAGQTIYGALGSLNVGVKTFMKVYAYNSSNTEISNKNVADDSGTLGSFVLPANTSYIYVSLTTQNNSYRITVDSIASVNAKMYCGLTQIKSIDDVYPKYESAKYDVAQLSNRVTASLDGITPLFDILSSELIRHTPDGNLFGMYSKKYTAAKTTENWQTASYIEFEFPASENDVVYMGCFSRDGLGTTLSRVTFYDSSDNVLLERTYATQSAAPYSNIFVNKYGGYISNACIVPAGTTRCAALFYGISNAGSAGQSSVIGKEYYVKNAFVYVGDLYNEKGAHLCTEWLSEAETISSEVKNKFCFGVETDTHYYIGKDDRVGYDLNEYANLVGMDFICNLGDLIQGFNGQTLDALDRTKASMTDIVKRYIEGTSCPMLFAIGNHDSNAIHHNAYGSPEISNEELYGRIIKYGLRTTPTAVYQRGKMYYYIDFSDVRVIVLNTQDTASVASFKVGTEQIAWFTNDALDTDKAVLVLSHTPLVNEFATNYDSSYASIVSALQTFKNNGGMVIACISGHTHEQAAATVNGIRYIVCTKSEAKENTAEIFIADVENGTLKSYGFGSATDRVFS